MATREEIEQIDVDAVADTPAARSMLLMFKTMLLQLMTLIDELHAESAQRKADHEAVRAENEDLKRVLFGQRSERRRRSERAPRVPVDPEEAARRQLQGQRKRTKNREAKSALSTREVRRAAPSICPGCESEGPYRDLPPEVSYVFEHVPAGLVRQRHVRLQHVCACGHIATGPAPARVGDCSHYGPGLHADAVVSKCADAMPINRLSKRYGRAGMALSRSTLNDLFHRTANLLEPLSKRLLEKVSAASHVNADETPPPTRGMSPDAASRPLHNPSRTPRVAQIGGSTFPRHR